MIFSLALSTIVDLLGANKLNEKGADLGGHSLRPFEDSKWWIDVGSNVALSVIGNYAEVRDEYIARANIFLSNC